MIDPRRLLILRAFASAGSVAATAKALYLTPSAVSQQLTALEAEAGQTLLVRAGRGLRLTPAGRILADHADRLGQVLAQAETDLSAHAAGASGRMSVAASQSVLAWLVAPAIRELRGSRRGVDVEVVTAESTLALGLLVHADVDAVIGAEYQGPQELPPGVVRFAICAEGFAAAVAQGHPLARSAGAVTVEALREEPWIVPPLNNPCRSAVLGACTTAGFAPRIRHVCEDFRDMATLVAVDGSVALVPEFSLTGAVTTGLVMLPTTGLPVRQVVLYTRSDNREHPMVRALLDRLRAAAPAG